jgi:hypothetical protein
LIAEQAPRCAGLDFEVRVQDRARQSFGHRQPDDVRGLRVTRQDEASV